MKKKKLLISTGGGDCPGLNAVIRAVVKAAKRNGGWQVWGSKESFNGVFCDPPDLVKLTSSRTAGIHVRGGTILKTTNRFNPMAYPTRREDGTWAEVNRIPELAAKILKLGFEAVINIGGDGSQRISNKIIDIFDSIKGRRNCV